MTAGWIIVNIALAVVVSALVTGVSVLVPHQLHRRATAADLQHLNAAMVAWVQHDGRQAA